MYINYNIITLNLICSGSNTEKKKKMSVENVLTKMYRKAVASWLSKSDFYICGENILKVHWRNPHVGRLMCKWHSLLYYSNANRA